MEMDQLVALCKRRGFLFQSSEIYGGLQGFWDYGPLGVELKRNVREAWWRDMVTAHNELELSPGAPSTYEMMGLDCAIIMHPQVWKCSGHYDLFHDYMQTCRQCKKLFRSDQVEGMVKESVWYKSLCGALKTTNTYRDEKVPENFTLEFEGVLWDWRNKKGKKLAPGLALVRAFTTTKSAMRTSRFWYGDAGVEPDLDHIKTIATENPEQTGLQTPCPECGGDLTEPREFNLMFETHTGAVRDESSKVFLRPETAQGIFVNFKNVCDSTRVRIPFGIAQIGKSFRNEITPRNFTFRSREFEQMEIEFFCHPSTSPEWYRYLARPPLPVVSRSGSGRRPAAAARPRQGRAEPLFLRHGRHRIRLSVPAAGRVRRTGGRGPSRRLRSPQPHGRQAGAAGRPTRRRRPTPRASRAIAAAART